MNTEPLLEGKPERGPLKAYGQSLLAKFRYITTTASTELCRFRCELAWGERSPGEGVSFDWGTWVITVIVAAPCDAGKPALLHNLSKTCQSSCCSQTTVTWSAGRACSLSAHQTPSSWLLSLVSSAASLQWPTTPSFLRSGRVFSWAPCLDGMSWSEPPSHSSVGGPAAPSASRRCCLWPFI